MTTACPRAPRDDELIEEKTTNLFSRRRQEGKAT